MAPTKTIPKAIVAANRARRDKLLEIAEQRREVVETGLSKGLTLQAIADSLGVDRKTIGRDLVRIGFSRPDRSSIVASIEARRAEVLRLRRLGHSKYQVAALLGVSPFVVDKDSALLRAEGHEYLAGSIPLDPDEYDPEAARRACEQHLEDLKREHPEGPPADLKFKSLPVVSYFPSAVQPGLQGSPGDLCADFAG